MKVYVIDYKQMLIIKQKPFGQLFFKATDAPEIYEYPSPVVVRDVDAGLFAKVLIRHVYTMHSDNEVWEYEVLAFKVADSAEKIGYRMLGLVPSLIECETHKKMA